MRYSPTTAAAVVAALAGPVVAVKEERTFAVLGFHGDGPLVEGCVDPIVSPGKRSGHVHTIMGASNFGTTVTAEGLLKSDCTNANVPGDNSVYWMPKLYFQDPETSKLEDVKLYYAKVYYFFESTDDDIEPFPQGLQMISGNASLRTPHVSGGNLVLDPEDGEVQPAQWTCPQADMVKDTYPVDSDGSMYGIKNSAPSAHDFGSGFPVEKCDRQFSPLRADLHFPSCYNPGAALDDWSNNMAWPSRKYEKNGSGRANCPPGYVHVPHLFFEYYWNTIEFMDRWEVDGVNQPFVLSNGDRTGFSLHGDFVAGWDPEILSDIIDNCDAGTLGMDQCIDGLDVNSLPKCNIESPVVDALSGIMDELPCGNSLVGWGIEGVGSIASESESMSYEPSDLPVADAEESSSSSKPSSTVVKWSTSTSEAAADYTPYGNSEAEVSDDDEEEAELAGLDDEYKVEETVAPTSEPEVADSEGGAMITEWVTETVVVSTTVMAGPEGTRVDYKAKRSGIHGHMHKHRRHGF
ncbi:hypothetical protein MKZ38_007587 [Zalerion maritima]|uniref:DUF1996 domain-containing protein n=1 Tax=Zalerion maritima TaxID=339359 RepID=A0AAD5RVI5_9PEZI|nr:hypothetical protein MKZ38_007587 [Zalerion maritima]